MQGENRLRGLSFFVNVSPDTVDAIWQDGMVKEVYKGTVLMQAKSPVQSVYFQLSGKSIIYNLTHAGSRKIIFIFGQGTMLNEHVFNDHMASTYCETIEKSRIFVIPVSSFIQYMKQDFSLVRAVLDSQERKIWRLGHQLKNTMGSIYMERKLAAKLWKLARDFGIETSGGIEINMNMTITFLADMMGTPRETASRLCRTLASYGLIKMDKKRITVTDHQKMSMFYKTGKIE